jgi:outer membrane protein TolC
MIKILKNIGIIALMVPSWSNAQSLSFDQNIDVLKAQNKISTTHNDLKINRSHFLPTLSLNTGLGSEFLKDNSSTDQGPYLFIEGKLNLYNGGADSNNSKIIQTNVLKNNLEKIIITNKLKNDTYKLVAEIEMLTNDNSMLQNEILENQIQLKMAQKKVDAGLTTAADLLDFEIKNENILNEIQKNTFRKNELEIEISTLLNKSFDLVTLKKELNVEESTTKNKTEIKNLPELKIQELEVTASKLEISNAKSTYLPTLDLEAKYGSITPHKKLFEDKSEHAIQLNLNIPLFSGFETNYKVANAVFTNSEKQRELKQVELELNNKFNNLNSKIELNNKILTNLNKSLINAKKYKDLIIFEYKKGIKNSADVISASNNKLEINRKINDLANENKILKFSLLTNFNTSEEL